MSVQTISDIIVSQQIKTAELKLSEQNQNSLQKSQNSTSFADLVSFYKDADEPKAEPVKVEESKSQKVSENNIEKTEDSKELSEKKSEVKEQKVEEKVSKVSVNEKTDSSKKTDTNLEVSKKSEKTNLKKSDKKIEAEDGQVQDQKRVVDFSRMNEITGKFENLKLKEIADSQKPEEKELKIEFNQDATSENQIELMPNLTPSAESLAGIENSETGEDKNFAELLEKNEKSNAKVSVLDSNGKITVEDLRTEKPESKEKNETGLKTELKIENENTATMTMNLVQDAESDVLSLNNQTAASNGSNFQTMLNNQVQQSVPEFVKAGNIVLKDNNQGTINLVLHPDDLGDVKIQLNLDGKTLTGHITVNSKEALQVFKDNAETLREAFIRNGLDAATFDVSYNASSNFAGNSGFEQKNDGTNIAAQRMYKSVGVVSDDYYEEFTENSKNSDNFSINIVA